MKPFICIAYLDNNYEVLLQHYYSFIHTSLRYLVSVVYSMQPFHPTSLKYVDPIFEPISSSAGPFKHSFPPPLHQKNSVDCKCVHTLVCCIKEHGITHIIHSMYIPHTKSKSSQKKLSTTLVDKRHNISFPILSSSSSQSIPTIHYISITPTSITISSITKFIPLTTQFFPPFFLGSFDTFTFPFHL